MNFESGTSLAIFQDKLFKQYCEQQSVIISKQDSNRLNNNLWVSLSSCIAPCNLVIRHRCLQDIFNCKQKFKDEILDLFKRLTPGLWIEGYSYWVYTKYILTAWAAMYYSDLIESINAMDRSFCLTAYVGKDGLLYPAPFSDLRDQPLESYLQNSKDVIDNIDIEPVSKKRLIYKITAYPLGCNLHVPINNTTVSIVNGIPQGFKFYEGYDKKYKSGVAEFLDMIKFNRIFSLLYR
jgi:hypothetical protein